MKAFIFLGIVALFAFFAFVPPQPVLTEKQAIARAEEVVVPSATEDAWLR